LEHYGKFFYLFFISFSYLVISLVYFFYILIVEIKSSNNKQKNDITFYNIIVNVVCMVVKVAISTSVLYYRKFYLIIEKRRRNEASESLIGERDSCILCGNLDRSSNIININNISSAGNSIVEGKNQITINLKQNIITNNTTIISNEGRRTTNVSTIYEQSELRKQPQNFAGIISVYCYSFKFR
jgi:hypothetical protein